MASIKFVAVPILLVTFWLIATATFYNDPDVRDFVSWINGSRKTCLRKSILDSQSLVCSVSEYPRYMEVMIRSDGSPIAFLKSNRRDRYDGPFAKTLKSMAVCELSERKVEDELWVVKWFYNHC